MNTVQRIALGLVIIGAINWGLIGFFNFDLVATIFGGQQSLLSRIVYALVGISGLYSLSLFMADLTETDTDTNVIAPRNEPNFGTEMGSEFDVDNKDDIKK